MKKIGILTFHYSNNYGAVLQALSLQRLLEEMGYDAEMINYVPSGYRPTNVKDCLGFNRYMFYYEIVDINIFSVLKKVKIMRKYGKSITDKFNKFRAKEMRLSRQVNENSLVEITNDYDVIIVGSDQVWNPSQRKRPEYFLDFGDNFKGRKISYGADSTVKDVVDEDREFLIHALGDFDFISVRNEHSFEFVKHITGREPEIVADPTVVYDFQVDASTVDTKEDYILTYILGKEIKGTHKKALEKIKSIYGDLPVYSIKIPTMNFELPYFADRVFYDLDPVEWLGMIKNAEFIYTDSFHGVIFSLKYYKPFMAYYIDKLRATRFIDMGKRYGIDKYIVRNIEEIDEKGCLKSYPDFEGIHNLWKKDKELSLKFLEKSLDERGCT